MKGPLLRLARAVVRSPLGVPPLRAVRALFRSPFELIGTHLYIDTLHADRQKLRSRIAGLEEDTAALNDALLQAEREREEARTASAALLAQRDAVTQRAEKAERENAALRGQLAALREGASR